MNDMFLQTEDQMRRISPFFPLSHGKPRVDDRRVLSGIVYVIRNGLMWRDAPVSYEPYETIYNRFIRWSRMGVFRRILIELARQGGATEEIMIDATHLKAHRTTASQPPSSAASRRSGSSAGIGFATPLAAAPCPKPIAAPAPACWVPSARRVGVTPVRVPCPSAATPQGAFRLSLDL